MFERFTRPARRAVVVLAEDEARALGHDWIGTEHILLGLIRERDGVAVKALKPLGISPKAARRQVEDIIGRDERVPRVGRLPFTPRSRKVLELSSDEARLLGHNYISTGHILLALVREIDGVAGQVLAAQGADLDTARQLVARLIQAPHGEREPETIGAVRRSGLIRRSQRKLLSEVLDRLDSMESRLRAIEHTQMYPQP